MSAHPCPDWRYVRDDIRSLLWARTIGHLSGCTVRSRHHHLVLKHDCKLAICRAHFRWGRCSPYRTPDLCRQSGYGATSCGSVTEIQTGESSIPPLARISRRITCFLRNDHIQHMIPQETSAFKDSTVRVTSSIVHPEFSQQSSDQKPLAD